jgi:hypothetical protein
MGFSGDDDFPINCTGDAVEGDSVRFCEVNAFENINIVTAKIVRDSYNEHTAVHTFELELIPSGRSKFINGFDLYKNTLWRSIWNDERARRPALNEKHSRGGHARANKR